MTWVVCSRTPLPNTEASMASHATALSRLVHHRGKWKRRSIKRWIISLEITSQRSQAQRRTNSTLETPRASSTQTNSPLRTPPIQTVITQTNHSLRTFTKRRWLQIVSSLPNNTRRPLSLDRLVISMQPLTPWFQTLEMVQVLRITRIPCNSSSRIKAK